jgi:uncharacterized membrane protein YjfL (UPF0719 family)
MFGELMLTALIWATAAIVISLTVSIGLMRWLGLPLKQLIHEIEDVQNTAVGACFFIISLTVSLFVSVYFSTGFSRIESFVDSAVWFASGLVICFVYIVVILTVIRRAIDRVKTETTYQYLRRELIEEQNAALAFFLGGITMPPFLAVLFQII